LSGTVEDEEFLGRLTSHDSPGKKVLGYDLTFSAPKSVSIRYGVGDEETSHMVRHAHDVAVTEALGYLERHARWTPSGPRRPNACAGRG
jgi:conjugative relaxase-like TrwC/TraI family protein